MSIVCHNVRQLANQLHHKTPRILLSRHASNDFRRPRAGNRRLAATAQPDIGELRVIAQLG